MQKRIRTMSRLQCMATVLVAWMVGAAVSVGSMLATAAPGDPVPARQSSAEPSRARSHLDLSGNKQVGEASFYKNSYGGKTMADGTPMKLSGDNAASTTLPLGTTAKVTNINTGRSAVITIRDRGPYVQGRIVDLSPTTARNIGISRKQGVAMVEIIPLTIPLADGTVKIGPMALAENWTSL